MFLTHLRESCLAALLVAAASAAAQATEKIDAQIDQYL